MELKEKIKNIMKELYNITDNYGCSAINTAIFSFMRYGLTGIDNITDEQMEKIHEVIGNWDESIMNEDLIKYIRAEIYDEEY